MVDMSRSMWSHVSMADEKRKRVRVSPLLAVDEPAFTRDEIVAARGDGGTAA